MIARDAARGSDAIAAPKLFRRSLEKAVEAAIKRALHSSDAVNASGEAQALREENAQFVAALAEVKCADDREVARLWGQIGEGRGSGCTHWLLPGQTLSLPPFPSSAAPPSRRPLLVRAEDLEVELAQLAAAIAADDAPPASPGALHAALESRRQRRGALRETQRRVGALEAEAQALHRQAGAAAEEAAGLREQVGELKKLLRKQAKRAAAAAAAAEAEVEADAEEGELAPSPPSAADQLRPLLESLRQQVVGSVMSELQAGLLSQMRQEITAAVGAALPQQQTAGPGGQGAGSAPAQPELQQQPDILQQLAAAVAAATASAPPPPEPTVEELRQLREEQARQQERDAQFLAHQNRLLSSLPPAVLPSMFEKDAAADDVMRAAEEKLVCPPCQATFPDELSLLKHSLSSKHLEVAAHVFTSYTGERGGHLRQGLKARDLPPPSQCAHAAAPHPTTAQPPTPQAASPTSRRSSQRQHMSQRWRARSRTRL